MLVISADIHAHAYTGSAQGPDGSNLRLIDIVDCLDKMRETAGKGGSIIIAGDLFHDRKGVRPEALHRVGAWLERCRDQRVTVYILVGNHDLSVGGDGCTSARALSGTAIVVEKSTTLDVEGVRVGFLPYTDDSEVVRGSTKALKKQGASILVAHLGLGDPKYADCVPSDYEVPGRINVSDLRCGDFDRVFLGHYHHQQRVTENCCYVGSPLQLSLKEAGQAKRFVTYSKGKVQNVSNDWSPRFHKLIPAEVATAKLGKRDHVVVVNATEAQAEEIRATLGEREGALRIEKKAENPTSERISADASGVDMLREYVGIKAPELSAADARELVLVGSSVLESSSKG